MYTQERCIKFVVYDVAVKLHICCIGDCRPGHARAVKLHICSACCMLCSHVLLPSETRVFLPERAGSK